MMLKLDAEIKISGCEREVGEGVTQRMKIEMRTQHTAHNRRA